MEIPEEPAPELHPPKELVDHAELPVEPLYVLELAEELPGSNGQGQR